MTAENGGRILLVLASQISQNVEQLVQASGLSLAELVESLRHLIDHGFVVAAGDGAEPAVFRLNPKGVRTDGIDPRRRILLIDDDAGIRRFAVRLLEGDGYSAIVVNVPGDGEGLLNEVAFDLVLTDGFSRTPDGVLVSTAGLIEAAGATPVVLFSAHRLDPDEVLSAGFRDLLSKPFDVEVALAQIRAIIDARMTGSQ
jgi:CheY-like chemotaxis protein